MGANFRVIDQQIWLDANELRKCSVKDHWSQWQESVSLTNNFELTGVGRPLIQVNETKQGAKLDLFYLTEIGFHAAPSNIQRDWDHFVVDSFIVPIHNAELRLIIDIYVENDARPGTAVSLASLFKMLQTFNAIGLKVSAPNSLDSLTKFEPRASNLSRLRGTPFPYQKTGIDWLTDYFDNSLGAMLCDEMGLGKTFQALGLMAHVLEKPGLQPILLIVPASLVENWKKEFATFLPEAQFELHMGPLRKTVARDLGDKSIVITTYETLVRDFSLFSEISFQLVLADEAQALKSRLSKRHRAVRDIQARSKVLITGTPVENKLKDLLALVEIIHPGLLGDADTFEELIEDTPEEARELGELASPLILRRKVTEVAKDLPELVEIDTPLLPSYELSRTYGHVLDRSQELVGQTSFLATLTALTQVCCHPKLVSPEVNDPDSIKFSRLYTILRELQISNEDKAIVFTTYIGSIDLIIAFINKHFGTEVCESIDGRTSPTERQKIVDKFNLADGFKVLVVNPKAGGTGLNITGANHVIHFNRQWNPAVEAQATARAYRRKQTKPVFVHKFFYVGTVEEVIHERLISKSELAEAALEDAENSIDKETRERILTLRPLIK